MTSVAVCRPYPALMNCTDCGPFATTLTSEPSPASNVDQHVVNLRTIMN